MERATASVKVCKSVSTKCVPRAVERPEGEAFERASRATLESLLGTGCVCECMLHGLEGRALHSRHGCAEHMGMGSLGWSQVTTSLCRISAGSVLAAVVSRFREAMWSICEQMVHSFLVPLFWRSSVLFPFAYGPPRRPGLPGRETWAGRVVDLGVGLVPKSPSAHSGEHLARVVRVAGLCERERGLPDSGRQGPGKVPCSAESTGELGTSTADMWEVLMEVRGWCCAQLHEEVKCCRVGRSRPCARPLRARRGRVRFSEKTVFPKEPFRRLL